MRVCIVTGSLPPEACGVGDYTRKLADALQDSGLEVELLRLRPSRIGNLASFRGRVERIRAQVVHIQYPTVGYGASLLPHALALALRGPVVTTLHEYSQAHVLRRASLWAFARSSDALVFTDWYERRLFLKRFPAVDRGSVVIPVGSSIPSGSATASDRHRIVYFGLLRPEKGLEEFLELASLVRSRGRPYDISIIAKPDRRFPRYLHGVRERATRLGVELALDLPAPQVADRLASASFAYLPYPDGASLRRTSLLAALVNGLVVLTTVGERTPRDLSETVLAAPGPRQALDMVEEVVRHPERAESMAGTARAYADRFRWEAIAREHVRLYESVVRRR
jgi:glycosyltransferase involved in cell wall biosynthesis